MFAARAHQLALLSLLCIGVHPNITAQPRWEFLQSPGGCGFYECAWSTTGMLYCTSDTCGVWRYTLSTRRFDSLVIDPSGANVIVPRSVDIDNSGKVHIVGTKIDLSKPINQQMRPFYCTSTDDGETWQHQNVLEDSYGSFQVVRCMQNGTVLIAAEVRYPILKYYSSHDSVKVGIVTISEAAYNVKMLSKKTTSVNCSAGDDYYTIRMTTDRYVGVAERDLAPCYVGRDPGSPYYSYRMWLSNDGGNTFSDSIYPSKPEHFGYYRPYRYPNYRNYLAPDYWIIRDSVTRDQGKTKFVDTRALSDGSGTILIDQSHSSLINGRLAVDFTSQGKSPDSSLNCVLGTFSLDGGNFNIEHRQSVFVSSVYPSSGNTKGYAVIPIRPQGLFVRIPDSSTTVDDASAESLRIYPNPGDDMVTVSGLTPDQEVTVMTMQGRVVYTAKSYGYSTTLDLSTLAVGSYLVRTSDGQSHQLLQVMR